MYEITSMSRKYCAGNEPIAETGNRLRFSEIPTWRAAQRDAPRLDGSRISDEDGQPIFAIDWWRPNWGDRL